MWHWAAQVARFFGRTSRNVFLSALSTRTQRTSRKVFASHTSGRTRARAQRRGLTATPHQLCARVTPPNLQLRLRSQTSAHTQSEHTRAPGPSSLCGSHTRAQRRGLAATPHQLCVSYARACHTTELTTSAPITNFGSHTKRTHACAGALLVPARAKFATCLRLRSHTSARTDAV